MQKIDVGHGEYAIVDDLDYELCKHFRWVLSVNTSGKKYAKATFCGRKIYLHRYIITPPENLEVDHKDGFGLNCQRSNLRVCTHSQNNMNKTKHCDNTSGYKGVHWSNKEQRWLAKIMINGKEIRVGAYVSAITAAWAYNHAAKQYHGEFANLNEVP